VQALCLLPVIQEQAVLGDARDAQVRTHAADSQHQRVVAQGTARHHGFARIVGDGVQHDQLLFGVHPGQTAKVELVVVAHRVCQETDLIIANTAGTRSKLMQGRFPHMGQRRIHKPHRQTRSGTSGPPEFGGQMDAADPAADNDNIVDAGDFPTHFRRLPRQRAGQTGP